ncbi:hypothetical protein B5S33_g1715 [[Candida] boidinii]|nr:hypothetical protein B5S33_g1715 [[Candida] boidinii]
MSDSPTTSNRSTIATPEHSLPDSMNYKNLSHSSNMSIDNNRLSAYYPKSIEENLDQKSESELQDSISHKGSEIFNQDEDNVNRDNPDYWPDFSTFSLKSITNEDIDGSFYASNSANLYNDEFSNLSYSMQLDKLDNTSLSKSATNSEISVLPTVTTIGMVEDPLHFLKARQSVLFNQLDQAVKAHRECLETGNGRVKKRRSKIVNTMSKLHQVHQSIEELYTSERKKRLRVLKIFSHWEEKKAKVLKAINYTCSEDTLEGSRYHQLSKESNNINNEIASLEERLSQLRTKQKAVNMELLEAQSYLEGKISPLNQSLETIENDEKMAIIKLNDHHQLTSNTYNFVNDVIDQNDGFSSKHSGTLLERFKNLNTDVKSLLGLNLNQEDKKAAISLISPQESKINTAPLIESLNRQVSYLNDLIENESLLEKDYSQNVVIIEDCFRSVKSAEEELVVVASSPNTSDLHQMLGSLLKRSLNTLNQRFDTISSLTNHNRSIGMYAKTIIATEINTLHKAIYMVCGDVIPDIQIDLVTAAAPLFSTSSARRMTNSSISSATSLTQNPTGTSITPPAPTPPVISMVTFGNSDFKKDENEGKKITESSNKKYAIAAKAIISAKGDKKD